MVAAEAGGFACAPGSAASGAPGATSRAKAIPSGAESRSLGELLWLTLLVLLVLLLVLLVLRVLLVVVVVLLLLLHSYYYHY